MTTSTSERVYNNNADNNADYNDDSFTEMGSMSDLKSVPSATVIASAYNSPIHSSASTSSSSSSSDSDSPDESSKLSSKPQRRKHKKWPKFKRFRDPLTGEEAIYELVEPQAAKGLFSLCSELVTLSSISIFVASNLFAFTVGILVGKRIAFEYEF